MALSAGNPQNYREELARWLGARQKYHAEYVKILNERKNDLLTAQMHYGPRSDAYSASQRAFERHDEQFVRIQSVLRRPVNKLGLPAWAFWVFACALAVFEAPVNKFLFDYAIQGSNLTSYIVSTMFAVLLLLLAHVGGKCLHQIWSEYRRRIVWSNLAIALLSVTVLVVLICILTIGRARYAAGAADPGLGGLFSEIGGEVSQRGFFGSLSAAFSEVSALVLFTVNLGGVVIAMLLGFFSHDPDKDFDQAEIELRRSSKRMEKIQKQYSRSRAKIIRKFAPDLTGASRNFSDANFRIIEAKTILELPLDEADKFVLENLDTLADEAAENDIANRLAGSRYAGDAPAGPSAQPRIRPIN